MFHFGYGQRSNAPFRTLMAFILLMNCISLPNSMARAAHSSANTNNHAYMSPAALQSGSYTITDLGTLGGVRSQAYGVNATGQVVGFSLLPGGALGSQHAFLYSGGTMQDIGTLGGNYSQASGINDSGQVVGEARIAGNTVTHAFLYSGGVMQDLGTLGGPESWAYAINNAGTVVGASYYTGGGTNRHAFRWTSGGGMQDLGTLGGAQSAAQAINTPGDIAGSARISGNLATHAALWPLSGGVIDLGTLGGTYSYGYGINDSNQVVGYSNLPGDSRDHAFLWTSSGGMQDIGTLGGFESYAFDINNSGQVVGWSYTSGTSNSHAYIYDTVNGMRDLNNLIPANSGWILVEARSINDSGQIVGYGAIGKQYHAFLLTPNDGGNQAPTANNQSVTVKQNTAKNITLTASDPDGDPLTYTIVTYPTNGTLSGTAPNLTYTPNAGFSGSDSFTFKVNDGTSDSNTATISITVNANRAPTANNQSVTTTQNTAKNITLTGSDPDGDPLTYTVVSNPTNGTLSGTAPNLTYTPNTGFTGSDSFTFKVNDGTSDSNVATVSITVNPPSTGTPTISSLTLTPTTVTGGCQTSTGKVTLSAAAPAGGATVALSSNNAAASVPASVFVPAGQTSATFTITTTSVGTQQRPVITAKLGTSQKTATLTVKPVTLQSLTLNPTSVKGGTSSTGTVTLACVSSSGSTTVTLKSSLTSAAQPAVSQITIPAGSQTGTFEVKTFPVTANKSVTITATANGSSKTARLTVTK